MNKVRPLACAALCAAALSSSTARAEDPPPVVRYPPSTVRPKLIVGGLAVTAIAYGAAFLGSEAASTYPGSLELKAPVVGPWIALAMNGCPPENLQCDAFVYLRGTLLVLDGLLQAAGLAIVAEGIVMKTEAVPLTPPPAGKPLAMFTWKPAPFVTPTSAGFGFTGTF